MPISKIESFSRPFCSNGDKNAIPDERKQSDADNLADYKNGFPSVTMTPKASGGKPPFGRDMNGILYSITDAVRSLQAGILQPYDVNFVNAIGGYNVGAFISKADGSGVWVNTVNANKVDPDNDGQGWTTVDSGLTKLMLTNRNEALTMSLASKPIIVLTGQLTGNVTVTFPLLLKNWTIVNRCTGNYSVALKTVSGGGVSVPNLSNAHIICDGVDIVRIDDEQREAIPTGTIAYFAGSSAPAGWLVCNGSQVSTVQYADLFSVCGNSYGSATQANYFVLPDLIGRFPQGAMSGGSKIDAGLPELPEHTHEVWASYWQTGGGSGGAGNGSQERLWGITKPQKYISGTGVYGKSTTVQPPALTLLPCIKI